MSLALKIKLIAPLKAACSNFPNLSSKVWEVQFFRSERL